MEVPASLHWISKPDADADDDADDDADADAGSDIDLLEDEDEAIGDRIMEVGVTKPLNWLTAHELIPQGWYHDQHLGDMLSDSTIHFKVVMELGWLGWNVRI